MDPCLYEVRNSQIQGAGSGLYTRAHHQAGETLPELLYSGDILTFADMIQLPLSRRDYIMSIGDSFVDAQPYPDRLARYINDSHNSEYTNNCRFEPVDSTHSLVVATTAINPGDELLVRYGLAYWAS